MGNWELWLGGIAVAVVVGSFLTVRLMYWATDNDPDS